MKKSKVQIYLEKKMQECYDYIALMEEEIRKIKEMLEEVKGGGDGKNKRA